VVVVVVVVVGIEAEANSEASVDGMVVEVLLIVVLVSPSGAFYCLNGLEARQRAALDDVAHNFCQMPHQRGT
jgi:hypothetical protein